jgi:uncharacterized protein YwqG
MFFKSETLEAVDLLLQTYRKPAIMLHRPYPPINLPPVRSRFGGLPQLPDANEWPIGRTWRDRAEVPLHFLAQIDCAELPSVDPRIPSEGMLFFFGRDNYDQLWDDGEPHDWMRVVYAPRVAKDQALRPAPPDLPPIGGDVRSYDGLYRRAGPWLLPEEAAPSVHAAWPVVPLRIDSWPDWSAIFETPLCRKLVSRTFGATHPYDHPKIMNLLREGKPTPFYDAQSKWQAGLDKLRELYERRLKAARTGAVVAATGLPTRAAWEPKWGTDFVMSDGSVRLYWPTSGWETNAKPFPQVGIMIDRIARLIVRETIPLLRHPSWQEPATQARLAEIQAAGRRWVVRAAEIGLDAVPPDADGSGFMAWLEELAQDNPSVRTRSWLKDILTKGILSSITYAAGSPEVANLIPPRFYNDLENHHLPFDQDKYALHKECEDWRLSAKHHQMLGYAPSCQDAEPFESSNVLLLQIFYDVEINMGFGDVGAASFWIKPDDLVARRFDKAWAEIVGH